MCLSRVFTDEEMEEWLADKPEVMVLEKGVVFAGGGYRNFHDACTFACLYDGGLNRANPSHAVFCEYSNKRYWPHYHFFEKAPDWMGYCGHKIIKCIVKKSWITSIGEDCGRLAIVAEWAVFPHYPETKARMEDVPVEQEELQPSGAPEGE